MEDDEHGVAISRNAAVSQGGGKRRLGGSSMRKKSTPIVTTIKNYETEKSPDQLSRVENNHEVEM